MQDKQVVAELLRANRHYRSTGRDVLAFAIVFDKQKLFKYLLRERGDTPRQEHLKVALQVKRLKMARHLIRLGLDINFNGGYVGVVASNAAEPSLRFLVDRGADVNVVDDKGLTPLHHIARVTFPAQKKFKTVKFLLEHGVDPNVKDNEGKTALVTYLKKKISVPYLVCVLKLFFKHGADETIGHPNGLSLTRLLLKFSPRREGGEHYKAAKPILESVTKWRRTKAFAEVCDVFFKVKHGKEPRNTAKRVRTSSSCSSSETFLEVHEDILRVVFSFLL